MKRVEVDKRTARSVAAGHPWIYADAIGGKPPRAGDEVEVTDRFGDVLGRALAEGRQGSGPALRMLTRDPRDPPLGKLLFRRIAAARRLRERFLDERTTAFRLLHGEGDGLPGLVVDRYEQTLVVRPDSQGWMPRMGQVVEALRSEGGGADCIVLKPKDGERTVLFGALPTEPLTVLEEGRRYGVRPGHGQKTGFFLDQRDNRTWTQRLAKPGDQALNLFSFTGGFSVAMALGGAAVTSVDLSQSIQDDCRAQFPLNGLDPEGHRFVAADIFAWLPKHSDRYDLIVCDPPALSRRAADLPQARAAYRRLHEGIAPLLKPGAVLVTCSCTARLTPRDLLDDATAGLAACGRAPDRVLKIGGAGADHPLHPGLPEAQYLSAVTLVVR